MNTNSRNVNLNNKHCFVSSVLFLIFFLLHFGVADAAPGDISTVAGNGIPGYSGDGDAATSASLDGPEGVVVDGARNIYIADHDNSRIRKVTALPINNCAATLSADFKGSCPVLLLK